MFKRLTFGLELCVALAIMTSASNASECISKYRDGTVYFKGETPQRLPDGGSTEIAFKSTMRFFYTLGTNAGSPKGGAIAIKRVYTYTHPHVKGGAIEIWRNFPKKRKARTVSLPAFENFHSNISNNDPNIRHGLHVQYHDRSGRSDDSLRKRLQLLPDDFWKCPSSRRSNQACKVMVLRYKGVNANGNCMDFNLLGGATEDDDGDLASMYLEVIELDHPGGAKTTFSTTLKARR